MHHSIALIGLAKSGKTVFLTALLDHLNNFDKEKLRLTPHNTLVASIFSRLGGQKPATDVTVRRFKVLPVAKDFMKFEYERYRSHLVEKAVWPEKTIDVSCFSCQFERSDSVGTVTLDFLDFPGERFGDACMIGKTFAEWSDETLARFENDTGSREVTGDYCRFANGSDGKVWVDYESVIRRYADVCSGLVRTYHPLICPSSFCLSADGHLFGTDGAPKPILGLSKEKQFAPLGAVRRERDADLAAVMQRNYDEYKSARVEPLFKLLSNCTQVLILVDIAGILMSGIHKYNEAHEIITQVLDACNPGAQGNFLKRLGTLATLGFVQFNYIERISLVATKSDQVRNSEVSRLRGLLNEMVCKITRDYDLPCEYFTCAAVASTQPHPNDVTQMTGYPVWADSMTKFPPPLRGDPQRAYSVSALPETWPDDWKAGEFMYPTVYPLMPRKNSEPPRQEGLGRVLDFLLTGKGQEGGS